MDMFKEYGITKEEYLKSIFTDFTKEELEEQMTADGRQILYSYNTPIIEKTADGNLKRLYFGWTATTGKHIKAFCGLDKKGFLSLPYELTEQDKAKLYNGKF